MWVWINISNFIWTFVSFFIIFVNILKQQQFLSLHSPSHPTFSTEKRCSMSVLACLFQQMKCNNKPVAQQIYYCRDKCSAFSPVGWWGSRNRQPSIGTIHLLVHLLVQYICWYNTGAVVQAPLCKPAAAAPRGLGSKVSRRRQTLSDKDSLLAFCTGMMVL